MSLSCDSVQLLKLNGALTYSDESGHITAATVISMLQEWMLIAKNTSLEIHGNILELTRICSGTTTLFNSNCSLPLYIVKSTDRPPQVQAEVADTSECIIGSFAGGLITGIGTSVLILCICFW